VDSDRFLDDQTVLDQFANVLPYLEVMIIILKVECKGELTGVSIGNFVDLVRIQPDLPFATFHNRRGKPLLKTKVTAI
jgi:hypothetical protein